MVLGSDGNKEYNSTSHGTWAHNPNSYNSTATETTMAPLCHRSSITNKFLKDLGQMLSPSFLLWDPEPFIGALSSWQFSVLSCTEHIGGPRHNCGREQERLAMRRFFRQHLALRGAVLYTQVWPFFGLVHNFPFLSMHEDTILFAFSRSWKLLGWLRGGES